MNFIAYSFNDYIPSILMMLHVIIRSQKEKAGFGPQQSVTKLVFNISRNEQFHPHNKPGY